MKDEFASDLIRNLPSVDKSFNDFEFFIKAASHLEKQLRIFTDNENKKIGFFDLIQAAHNKDSIAINKKTRNTLHCFRRLRNSYAHDHEARANTKRSWIRFINKVESEIRLKGSKAFPVKSISNKRHIRLYFAYVCLWQYIHSINNPSGRKPANEIMQAYIKAIESR